MEIVKIDVREIQALQALIEGSFSVFWLAIDGPFVLSSLSVEVIRELSSYEHLLSVSGLI